MKPAFEPKPKLKVSTGLQPLLALRPAAGGELLMIRLQRDADVLPGDCVRLFEEGLASASDGYLTSHRHEGGYNTY